MQISYTDVNRSRSELPSAVFAFFTRLKNAATSANRGTVSSVSDSTAHQFIGFLDFHKWFLIDFVDSGLLNYRRPPVVKAILALNLLGVYLNVFADTVQEMVFTHDRVTALFACQASEFTEVRFKARNM
jgi:hypothetical protein